MNIETPICYNQTSQKNIHLKSSVSFFIKTICEIHFFKFLNSASLEREKLLVLIFFFSSIRGFFFVFVFLKKFINSHSFFFVLEKKKTERSINGLCSLYSI